MASRSRRSILGDINESHSTVVDQAESIDMQKELVTLIMASHKVLQGLWDKIGLCEQDRDARTRKLIHYHNDLQRQMIEEETGLYERVAATVEEMKLELWEVRKQLKQPEVMEQDEQLQHLGFLQQERKLKQLIEELHDVKYDRMENLLKLLEQETTLCQVLDMPPVNNGTARTGDDDIDDANVPSEEQMKEIEQHIAMLSVEKTTRLRKMDQMRFSIKDLLSGLELLPTDEFQENVMLLDVKTPSILSQDSLHKTKEWMDELLAMAARNKALLKRLLSQLILLWDGLEIGPPQREDFLSQYPLHGQNTINAMTQEIARYQEMKRQNMGKFVDRLRQELLHLWDKCYVSEEERANFVAFQDGTFTEDLLELHETEVSNWKSLYEDNQEIYTKIVRYLELWEQKKTYDKKSNDPSRFYNRGGNLLQEEKTRKRIEHELPKLELEIIKLIETLDAQRGAADKFLVYGVPFQHFVQQQHEQLKLELENEKKQRALKKAEEVGKNLATPTKRKANSTKNTPASVAKHPRLNIGQKPLTMGLTSRSPAPATIRHTESPTKRQTPKKAPRKSPTSTPGKTPIVTPLNMLGSPARIILNEIQANPMQPPMDYARASITYSEFTEELKKKDDGIFNSTTATAVLETVAEKMEIA